MLRRPGFARAVVGLIIGLILGVALITLIRALVFSYDFASGPAVLFGGFGGLFGWLWGVGSFNPYSHEHHGIEHAIEHPEPTAIDHALEAVRKEVPVVAENTKPFLQPLLLALGVCVAVVLVFMALGMIPTPLQRVTTENAAASAVTPEGLLNLFGTASPAKCVGAGAQSLPPGSCGLVINKTLFFLIVAVVLLVMLAILAIVLGLLMGALGNQVETVKKLPDQPPVEEPQLFRLIDFFISWVNDLFEGLRQSVSR